MPTIFVFPGVPNAPHECHYHAVAEDGEYIFMTRVIPEHFAKDWMIKDFDRDCYLGAAYREKYPQGFELIYVRDWKTESVLRRVAGVA